MTSTKIIKGLWIAVAAGAGLFQINACTHEYLENVAGVCFETEVLPIFQSNCTQSGCHNGNDRVEGYDLSTHAGISRGVEPGDYRNSEVYRVLVRPVGFMPPKPHARLTEGQITSIALWIEQGAENTTGCGGGGCDTTNVTYSAAIKPLLNTYCNGCHAGSVPQGDIDLTTYANVKVQANSGALLGSVAHTGSYSPMPKNGNQLSDCNIALIRKWIELGAPDN